MRHSKAFVAALSLLAAVPTWGASLDQPPANLLAGKLVRVEAGRLVSAPPLPADVPVLFYFGAGWCGPCRAFVPELKQAYAELRAQGAGMELVFISDDGGCRAMADYILSSRMPWPVLRCQDRQALTGLQALRGAALPGLLLVGAGGNVLVSSWDNAGTSAPRAALGAIRQRLSSGEE